VTPPAAFARLVPIGFALALGAIGGALFFTVNMPLAWMIGAMCFTTIAALAGAPVAGPGRLRNVMVTVLGVMLGSTFTPEVLDRAGQWMISIACLVVFIAAVVAAVGWALHRWAGFARPTAYFSATPGGLVIMVLLGGSMGGDERTIALMHSMRLLMTVLVIPFWFVVFQGYEPGGTAALARGGSLTLTDAGVLTLCAVLGYWLASRARIPAAALVGPMLLSAAVHLSGLSQATPPGALVALAQVVMGTAVGCRFAGVSLRRVLKVMVTGAATTVFMMAAAAAFALVIEAATGLSFQALVLAFSPGGLAEMTLISLSLGIDTAFVSTHHLVRILFLVGVAPIAYRLVAGPGAGKASE
jgi:membrane AbrB-like protein